MSGDLEDFSGIVYPALENGIGGRDFRRGGSRAVVLELVRTRGPVSRADLTRSAGLSMPAVMEIVDRLVSNGLVRERGRGPSTGGRRPVLLEFVPEFGRAIGVEVGARTLAAVVTDLNGAVKARREAPSEMSSGGEALKRRLRGLLEEILGDVEERAFGIGLSLPAPLLTSREMVFSPPSYPGWGEMYPSELVGEGYGIPILVDNDANAAALGEHLFGAGRRVGSMFYIAINRGVGGAAIFGGELHRGAVGGAGEIGHTLIDLEGPRCGCGNYGCLEAFVGRAAIARRASLKMRLLGGEGEEKLSTQQVIEAALAGDAAAIEALEETGRYVGIGLSNAVNMFDPELVVVGGSSMRAGDLILKPAAEVVHSRAIPGMADRVRIVAGSLGDDAGPVGAAALVLRELFARVGAGYESEGVR